MCCGQSEVSRGSGAERVEVWVWVDAGVAGADVVERPSRRIAASNNSGSGVMAALRHGRGTGDSAGGGTTCGSSGSGVATALRHGHGSGDSAGRRATCGGGVVAERCDAGLPSMGIRVESDGAGGGRPSNALESPPLSFAAEDRAGG
jgi:hypothetical protein